MRALLLASLVFVLAVAAPTPAPAQTREQGGLTESESRQLYREFSEIRSFGVIALSLLGDAEKIGLRQKELLDLIRSRYKAYFKEIPYQDLIRDPDTLMNLVISREKEIGNITFRVWVIGEDYPVVYHIRCDAGNFDNPSIYTEEVLGHGTAVTAPENVRNILGEMMSELAVSFFKSRSGDG
ncbi:MAG: hypothetical protein ABFD62_17810 [Syntrophaceae bacterium]